MKEANLPNIKKYNLPVGWNSFIVSEVFEFLPSNSFSRSQLDYTVVENCIYNIHYGDIHATYKEPLLDFLKENKIPIILPDVELPNSLTFLEDGDVIMADASEDYKGVGEVIELKNIGDKKVVAGLHTFVLRDNSGLTVNGFRTYVFKHPIVSRAIKVIATGSKVYGISKTNLANVKLILPSLDEQQKIANILNTWDKAIDTLTKLIVLTEKRKKEITQILFTEKIRFKGFTMKWKIQKIQEVAKINQGLQISISERFTEEVDNSYFYITNEFLKSDSNYKYFIVDPPKSVLCSKEDILMTRTGNTGKVVTNVEGAFHNNFFKIKFNKAILNKDYLFYLLNSNKVQYKIMRLAGTSTIPDLNHSDFYRIKIEIPELIEQKKIASFLALTDSEIEKLKMQLEFLNKQKKGLMQILLTGKQQTI